MIDICFYLNRHAFQIIVQNTDAWNNLNLIITAFQHVASFHNQTDFFSQFIKVLETVSAAACRLLGHAHLIVIHSPITPIGKNDARMLAEFLHAVSVQPQIAVQEQCFSVKQLRFHAFKSSKIGCAIPKRTATSKRYPYKRPAFFICKLCDFRRPILPFEKNQMRWVSFHKTAPLLCCPMISCAGWDP